MKFALHLRENLVPEWRDQYFDYKLGKKKLKRLESHIIEQENNEGSRFGLVRRATRNHSLAGTAPQTPQPSASPAVERPPTTAIISPEGTRRDQTVAEFSSNLPYSVKPSRTLSAQSLSLPPPAISPVPYSDLNNSSGDEDAARIEALTDKSPLLMAGNEPNGNKNASYQATCDSHSAEAVAGKASGLRKRGPSRKSILKSPSGIEFRHPILDVTEEEDEFLYWVDSEARKIEKFYVDKEKDAVRKFLILQDQLVQLQMHRSALKRALGEDNNDDSHSGAVTGVPPAAWKITAILTKLDISMPILMKAKLTGRLERDKTHEQHGDYSRKNNIKIPYTVARHRLKAAVNEYYRSLELLKGYRQLNATALRKIMKKFDKRTHNDAAAKYMAHARKSLYFMRSDLLADLIPRTEDLYAYYFEKGSHKMAVEKLRAKDYTPERTGATFRTGYFIGLSVPLFVQAIIAGVRHLNNPAYPDTRYLFQIWGGFFMANLILCLFTINLYVWTKYKINYPFVFEFNQRHHLDYKQFGEIPAFTMFLLSFLGWFSLNDFWPNQFPGRYYPPIYLGICVIIFLVPVPILHWRARRWLAMAIVRLFVSGLVPVEFRDFFLGDVFCSLNYSISNASFFFCLYATHWEGAGQNTSRCSSSHSRLLGFLNTLPGIWRFLQCWRRFGDTGDWFPHLANALKYSCLILYYTFLSLARIDRSSVAYHACFILFAALNATYSLIWDIFMDFSLGQFNSKNFLLRDELAFPSKIPYYGIMLIDPILRFNWVLYAIFWNQIEQSAKISFFVSLIEVFRRFLWVFFRVENEHSSNVGRYRASRDVTLPYEKTVRHKPFDIGARSFAAMDFGVTRREGEESQGKPPSTRESDENVDIHTGAGASTSMGPQKPQESPGMRRRFSLVSAATPVLAAVSLAMKQAHTADFERRRKKEELDDDEDGSDEDSDNESQHHRSGDDDSHSMV